MSMETLGNLLQIAVFGGLILAGALAYGRFWCRICPLGGLTALFSTFSH